MEIMINHKKIMKFLIILVVILSIASVAGQIYKYNGGHHRYLVSLFDLDKEWNIPTWYASTSLLLCSILLAIISFARKKNNCRFFAHWISLSVIFFLLALDESLQFHEQTSAPLRQLFHAKGLFHFTWVVPAFVLLLIFGLAYFKFLYSLTARMRVLFIISGAIYVGGALLMELVGGYYSELRGQNNLIYALLTNFEEFMEMIGILVFIYALFSFTETEIMFIKICFKKL